MRFDTNTIVEVPMGATVQRAGMAADAGTAGDLHLSSPVLARTLHNEDVWVPEENRVRSDRGFYVQTLGDTTTLEGVPLLSGTTLYVLPYVSLVVPTAEGKGAGSSLAAPWSRSTPGMIGAGLIVGAGVFVGVGLGR